MSTESDIARKFGEGAENPEILRLLKDIESIYSLDTEELYIKWEQFSYHKNGKVAELNLRNVELFKGFIQQQIERKAATIGLNNSGSASVRRPKIAKPSNGGSPSLFGFASPKTPLMKKRRTDTTPSKLGNLHMKSDISADDTLGSIERSRYDLESPSGTSRSAEVSSPFMVSNVENKTEKGQILLTLNPQNIEMSKGQKFETKNKVSIVPFFDSEKYQYRTMRQNILEAADVLDEQIDIFTEAVQQHYNLAVSDIGDPSRQSQSEIIAVGRIVADAADSESNVNIHSLAIEASRSMGIGRRVRLNLEKIEEASFFQGQIVALRGKNANGEYFMVEEVMDIPFLNSPVSTLKELKEFEEEPEEESLKIVITKGPYTAANELDFSFLKEFVERLNTELVPHVLMMFGPFLDIMHSQIESGCIPHFPGLTTQPRTLDEIFNKVVSPILKNINEKIQVILIPSTNDAIMKHASYPQCAMDRKALHLPKTFKCFPNPSIFKLNEFFFGCSNLDAFKDIREAVKGGKTYSRNRLDRIAEHVLQQRRFYPSFPGSIKKRKTVNAKGQEVWEHLSGANLEVDFLGLSEFVAKLIPDVVLIPSELTYFARIVRNVLFVNPGPFVRPTGLRGSFAQVCVQSPEKSGVELTRVDGEEVLYTNDIWKRSRVDIIT
ncbi:LAMI_0E09230g1_1 [Lachancea mirantina]|uniref:DNA polymerase alpha subunit B n=1 Tax=Lachancea mirantina TaxID=1230905 RepID=A0A1G4JND3_9SACH|nr:LAMI_0E09230g1_1 [Lachancea mirantina]